MPEKIAIVTGSSSGFGLLTSVELAKAGFRVVASMRDRARREKLDLAAGARREKLDLAAGAAGVAARIDVRTMDVTKFDTIPGFVEAVVRD